MPTRSAAQLSALKNAADLSGELSALGLRTEDFSLAERLYDISNRLAETTGKLAETTGHSVETVFGVGEGPRAVAA